MKNFDTKVYAIMPTEGNKFFLEELYKLSETKKPLTKEILHVMVGDGVPIMNILDITDNSIENYADLISKYEKNATEVIHICLDQLSKTTKFIDLIIIKGKDDEINVSADNSINS
jgi:hypothetical protein